MDYRELIEPKPGRKIHHPVPGLYWVIEKRFGREVKYRIILNEDGSANIYITPSGCDHQQKAGAYDADFNKRL